MKAVKNKAEIEGYRSAMLKDGVAITNDYKIKKREVGDEDYEYQVQFSAREEVQL